MVPEQRIVVKDDYHEEWKTGYFLSLDEIQKLVRDFQTDCHDGFISNDKSYLENWLEKL